MVPQSYFGPQTMRLPSLPPLQDANLDIDRAATILRYKQVRNRMHGVSEYEKNGRDVAGGERGVAIGIAGVIASRFYVGV